MSAFISDKSLMTIVEILRDIDQPSADEAEALEECLGSKYKGGVVLTLEYYKEMMAELARLQEFEMLYDPPAGEPIGMAKLIAKQKSIDPELAKHSSEVVDELLKADHIPDAPKKVETPEEAAEKWLEDWLQSDLEEGTPSSQMEDAFLAGYRLAEERAKK